MSDNKHVPKIFDALSLNESVPSYFNAVRIPIDGHLKADLKWEEAKKRACWAADQGLKVFWEINLGLFSDLIYPLNEEVQYKTLQLSLKTFCEHLWNQESIGLCLYRASADFTLDYPWSKITKDYNHHERLDNWLVEYFQTIERFSKETGIDAASFEEVNYRILLQNPTGKHLLNIFCRDVCVDYLDMLTEMVSDEIPLFVMLDAFSIQQPGHLAQVLSKERFERYRLLVRGGELPITDIAWDDQRTSRGVISRQELAIAKPEYATLAICLPQMERILPSHYLGLNEALLELNRKKIHYRIVPEAHLTMEWEGLDHLIYIPEGLSELGERKLQGFCAAGGTAITLGEKKGFPLEMTFHEWMERLLETF